jgi:hypothetical protein
VEHEVWTGHCLCGAVTITARRHDMSASACHCETCRRWTGGALFCFDAPEDAVTVDGPVARYRSSGFAERAWCPTCGTHLWIKDDNEGFDLFPGLFPEAARIPLSHEIFIDEAMACTAFAGEHPRVTREAYMRSVGLLPEKRT